MTGWRVVQLTFSLVGHQNSALALEDRNSMGLLY